MPNYTYEIEGTAAAAGQTWKTSGTIQKQLTGDFLSVVEKSFRDSFQQLTEGKAVYGQPGVGCFGPYTVNKVLIERTTDG